MVDKKRARMSCRYDIVRQLFWKRLLPFDGNYYNLAKWIDEHNRKSNAHLVTFFLPFLSLQKKKHFFVLPSARRGSISLKCWTTFFMRAFGARLITVTRVKVVKIVRARDYWIFLVAQQFVPCLEMDKQGLLGI